MNVTDLEAELEKLHADSFGWALACCSWDRSEAEEVVQATYLKVLDGAARFDRRSTFKTWLFAVMRRTAAERRRRARAQALAFGNWFARSPRPEAHAIEAEVQRSEASARLVKALERLPERQREVLHLVFYQDLSIREAALIMGVSLGAARRHYARAKQRLRLILDAEFSPGECLQ